jgi:acyl-coenzyme A synthetase/AMP-(fatty) acid ligase
MVAVQDASSLGAQADLMNAAEHLLSGGVDDKVAIECWDRHITYGGLRDAVARAAAYWREHGLEPGDRVLVFAPDSIDWVIAYLGAIWAGGVAVGLNSRLFERELSVILGESGARFLYCEPGSSARLEPLLAGVSAAPAIVTSTELSAALPHTSPAAPVARAADDPAVWVYTSGTTGKPKAVVHTHGMVLGTAEFSAEVLKVGQEARIYASSKLFFSYALGNGLFGGLLLGGTVVLDPEWPTAERVAAVVERHAPNVIYSVPTLYMKMLEAGIAPKLAGVSHFVSAGETMPAQVASAWQEATGSMPVNAWGASETVVLMLYCRGATCVLTPSPHVEVRPRDNGFEGGAAQRLWLRHASVASGYWQRPEAERDAFEHGWFSPGDLFRSQDGGRWEFCGRSDDLVKISGQWVSTIDVEQALIGACGESVAELAALPFTNNEGLTSIAIFAVHAPGLEKTAASLLQEGIEALPKFRRPREVRWLAELPRSDTGKLQRKVLRERYLEEAKR